jgi:hypothetical protein
MAQRCGATGMVACSDGAASAWRRGPEVDGDLRTRSTEGVGGDQHIMKTQRRSSLPRRWRRELYLIRTRPRSAGTPAAHREGGGAHCFSDGLHAERKWVRMGGQHWKGPRWWWRAVSTRRRGGLTVRDEACPDKLVGFGSTLLAALYLVGNGWRALPRRANGSAVATEPMTGGPHASDFLDSRIKPEDNFQHGINR